MLSNTQKRLCIQQDLESSGDIDQPPNDARQYSPGDQVYFKIPANPGETDKVWGYVLKPVKVIKADDPLNVVVDSPVVFNRNPKYQCGSVLRLKVSDIRAVIKQDINKPIIRVTLEDGALIDLLRIDGKTTPLNVLVDYEDSGAVYEVDHRNFHKVGEPF